MNKKIYNAGTLIFVVALTLFFIGYFFYYKLWGLSKILMLVSILLNLLGIVISIIGILMKDNTKTRSQQLNLIQKEVYSGICPVCNQKFETTAEIINGYYVFNCNKCNSKLRVKKLNFFPVG